MIYRQIETLFKRSKTPTHLLQIHSLLLKSSLDKNKYLISKFILSSSSISPELTISILNTSPITPSLFAWNVIIKQYSKSSTPIESIKLFIQLGRVGLKPDKFTYPFVLKACGRCSMVGVGGGVHCLVLKVGFDWDRYIGNTLLWMYTGCGDIGFARNVFDEMRERDVVSWSSMIAGYVACNCPLDALTVFQEMKLVNEKPNSITLVSLLSACISLFNIRLGESIHSHIIINDIELNVSLGTALLEMYAKCGHVEKALRIFNSMREKNLQTWTVMISGLADHSRGEEAISFFTKMEESGLEPDSVSFCGVLSACSHLGLVDQGRKYYDQMVEVYNIRPRMEHYGCMVDMLGRAGMIEEAYRIIMSMPMKPGSVILRSYISACKHQGNIVCVDENLKRLLLEIEPELGSNYVLAASISSLSGYWSEVDNLRIAMRGKGMKKVPGCSWVEASGGSS